MTLKRKICVVTGTRAEYGLLRLLMQAIKDDPSMDLQIVVTGMHLSPEFGLTWQAIEQDGFSIDHKVDMLLSSDTPVGIGKSMGLGLIGFSDIYQQLQPDLLLILGDRFEILAAASAAMVARIPIAHLHGGEVTEGVIDEAIRHAVTKMSHYHFVANSKYRRRVIQLGEDPSRVFTVGGLGLDNLVSLKLMQREDLEIDLGYRFQSKNLLVTFHPVTLDANKAAHEFNELLDALDALQDTGIIFTLPNADTESRSLIKMTEQFVAGHPLSRAYPSLGQLRYLSCMNLVDGVVGNSSSGIIEAPSLFKGTVNIGARQDGRQKATSIIDCEATRADISQAIQKLYSASFLEMLPFTKNPYGEPGASMKIATLLPTLPLEGVLKKRFFDIDQSTCSAE